MRSSSTSRSSPRGTGEHHRISSFSKMDPLKSSILASSQGGWTQSPASPSATSPLRISKRDAESIAPSLASLLPKNANHSGVTRRSSSSYNHMRNHSLVSKSVFKSPDAESEDVSPSMTSDMNSPEPVHSSPGTPKSRSTPGGPTYPSHLGTKPSSKHPSPRRVSPSGHIRTSGSGTIGLGITARKASPGQAARRVSIERKNKHFNSESFRIAREKAKALEAKNRLDEGLLGYKRRQSKGLQGLERAEYVSKSPFVSGPRIAKSGGSPLAMEIKSGGLERQSSLIIHDVTPEKEVRRRQESRSPPVTPSPLVDASNHPSHEPQDSPFSPAIFITQDYNDGQTDEDDVKSTPISSNHRQRRSLTPHESPVSLPYLRKSQSPSPFKSSLKSRKRLRGPRSPDADHLQRSSSGGRIISSGSRRKGSIRRAIERRKTVTFDEQCDVVEFEREDHEEMYDEEWVTSEDEDVAAHLDESYEYDEHDRFDPQREEEMGRRMMAKVDAIDAFVTEMLEDELAYEQRHHRHHTPTHDEHDDGDRSFDKSQDSIDQHSVSSLIIKPIPEEQEDESHPEHDDDDLSFDQIIKAEDTSIDLSIPPPPPPPAPFTSSSVEGSPIPLSESKSSSYASLSRTEGGRSSPRISKDDVKRRLMLQRGEGSVSPDIPSPTSKRALPTLPMPQQSNSPTVAHRMSSASVDMTRQTESSDAVLQRTARNSAIDPPRPTLGERSTTSDGTSTPISSRAPGQFGLDGGVDIADVRSALDRLMLGVINDRANEPKIQQPLPLRPPSTPPPKLPRPASFMGMSPASRTPEMTHQHLVPVGTEASVAMSPRTSTATTITEEDGPRTPPVDVPSNTVTVESNMQEEDIFRTRSMSMLSPPTTTTGANLIRKKSGKEIIKAHEAAIIAKRREMRRNATADDDDELETIPLSRRKSKRRSLSTGDADDRVAQIRAAAVRSEVELLDVEVEESELPFTDSVDRELKKMFLDGGKKTYHLTQHEKTIYASSAEKSGYVGRAGDMHAGKPWRVVRRASDMNEYSRQIKEFRAQEKGKAHGKVFVKVLGIKNLKVPLPSESTSFTLVLNNGVFSVETPECTLAKDARVDQEFELIEHGKLEFTLTVKIQKDAHILAQLRSHAAPTPPPVQIRHPPPPPMPTELPLPPPPKASGGLFGLFGGSKKPKHRRAVTEPQQIAQPPPPPPPPAAAPKPKPVEVNLGRYLRPDGSLATAFINFSEIARRCDTKLFETSYPLKALVSENRNRNLEEQPVLGEVILHIFRLPPIPGVKPEGLPQSLEECHSGLRHIAWHKVMYHEGVLTQQGGDCNVWKRRHFRIIGANLVAYNDVTNRATTSIELKKATAVVDDQDPPETIPTITKGKIRKLEDELYPVERSFRLLFRNDVQISFYADTDEEKSKWLQMLRAMVGKIPPNPLWAELVWQRQEEMAVAAARASKAPAKTQS